MFIYLSVESCIYPIKYGEFRQIGKFLIPDNRQIAEISEKSEFSNKNSLTISILHCIIIIVGDTTKAIRRLKIGESYMFVKDVMVQNQVGLHARPATFFIQKANEFKSSIWIEKEERRVNAKSLLGILSLGIVGGTQIRVIADGPDEQEAVEGLVELVESGFSEEA